MTTQEPTMERQSSKSDDKLVTVIVGSGRKERGHTYLAARRFLDDLEARGGVRGELVFLSEQEIGLCRGCKACFERGEDKCPLGGDMRSLVERMMASDGVVIATPNYSFQVSAQTKAFLDRLGYVLHRPCFHGKTFTSIVAQGVFGGKKLVKYLGFVGQGLGFDVVPGTCHTAFEPMPDKARRKMDATLAAQGARFHRQLFGAVDAAPTLFQLMAFRMARTSMHALLAPGSRDYDYYQSHGWFESDYYRPARLGLGKRAMGSFFDWMFGRIYKAPRDETSSRGTGPERVSTDEGGSSLS